MIIDVSTMSLNKFYSRFNAVDAVECGSASDWPYTLIRPDNNNNLLKTNIINYCWSTRDEIKQ